MYSNKLRNKVISEKIGLRNGYGKNLFETKYSRTPLFRSLKGNGKKVEIARFRNNRGSVKRRVNPREFDLPRNSGDFELTEFEIAGFDCIILNLKRQTSGRHFGPVIQSFDGMFNRALIIKY